MYLTELRFFHEYTRKDRIQEIGVVAIWQDGTFYYAGRESYKAVYWKVSEQQYTAFYLPVKDEKGHLTLSSGEYTKITKTGRKLVEYLYTEYHSLYVYLVGNWLPYGLSTLQQINWLKNNRPSNLTHHAYWQWCRMQYRHEKDTRYQLVPEIRKNIIFPSSVTPVDSFDDSRGIRDLDEPLDIPLRLGKTDLYDSDGNEL